MQTKQGFSAVLVGAMVLLASGMLLLWLAYRFAAAPAVATPTPTARTAWVTLSVANHSPQLLPFAAGESVADVLARSTLPLPADRQLWLDGQPLAQAEQLLTAGQPHLIQIYPYIAAQISINNTPHPAQRMAGTVGDALAAACDCPFYLGDRIEPAWWQPLQSAATPIAALAAAPVQLALAGQTQHWRSNQTQVAAVLAEQGVSLWGQEASQPAAELPLNAERSITVLPAPAAAAVSTALVPFERQQQADPNLPLDQSRVLQRGVNGISVTWQPQFTTAQPPAAIANWLAVAPKPHITGYGTQIQLQTLATSDGNITYWRATDCYATSYSPARAGVPASNRNYGRTRSGKMLTKGLVAVDPNVIPLGTLLYVPGYGFAEAADTGGGVRGRMIDLGYDDWNYESWHQTVTVYWLAPAPPAEQIQWILPK